MHTRFWSENLKGRDYSEDLGVKQDNIRMDLRKIGWEGVDSVHLVQDTDWEWVLVKTVMKFWVP
jgi:hypothetical protein